MLKISKIYIINIKFKFLIINLKYFYFNKLIIEIK
jgi:hypothetical protein